MSTSSLPTFAGLEPSAITSRIQEAKQRLSLPGQWRAYIVALVINDIVMLFAAFGLAYWIRFGLSLSLFDQDTNPVFYFYIHTALLLIAFWLAAFYMVGLYDKANLLGGTTEYARVFQVSSLGVIAVVIVDYLLSDLNHARGWLLMMWAFSFLFIATGRFCLRRVVYALRKRGYFTAHALIIGANEEGFAVAEQLSNWKTSGLNILGYIDDDLEVGERACERHINLGNIDQLDAIIEKYNIEELILATGALPHDSMIVVFKRYGLGTDVNLRLSSGLFGVVTTGLEVTQMAFVPLIRVNKMRFTELDRVLKFVLDYVITLFVFLIAWPVFLLIALAIKLDSPGPISYRRHVMGLNGRKFDAFKFRTMYVDGDELLERYPELKAELEKNHKLKDDPRVTRVGGILRRYSLDELPQLINVLRREMSLVGPRMISPQEMELFGKWDTNLLTVNPGLTGLWQVSGRSDTTYDERVQMDMQYIRNWTIWSDIYLLLRTIPAVLMKRGAY